ncbi:hypothetical protein GCM10010393_28590 [Streptomyces gobitricini]|uniref:Uncharacterized protein n=1 Tax=Streptomyces gobitricini TaxID=68211 RepID=A0ABN3M2M9_9ACTN
MTGGAPGKEPLREAEGRIDRNNRNNRIEVPGAGGRLWPGNGCRGVRARAMLRWTSQTPAWPNAVVVLVSAGSGQDSGPPQTHNAR